MMKGNLPSGAKSKQGGNAPNQLSGKAGAYRKAGMTGSATRQGMMKKPVKKGC
jgi:hypothetical protein